MDLYYLFVLMAAATVMSPGPGVLMTLTNALYCGRRETIAGVLGIASGALVVAAISATSLGMLLAASATAYMILKFLGAGYLIYLGFKLWRAPAVSFSGREARAGNAPRRFAEGITLQLTNPKAVVFFLSVFPQFIEPSQAYMVQFATLVLTYCALVVVIHCIYAGFASRAKKWLTSPLGGRIISRGAALVFVMFGAALLMSPMHGG